LRILVAEDNPVNQLVAVSMLQKRGHTVTVAGDGAQALAAMAVAEFDVVLMDLQMPGMDGFTATTAIRDAEKGTTRHIPIVALTGHALAGHAEGARQAGCDSFVTKPCLPDALVAEIKRMLATRTQAAGPGKRGKASGRGRT
jgi:CheY-like chemotaxis protein